MEFFLSDKDLLKNYKLLPDELKIAASSYFKFLVNNYKKEANQNVSDTSQRELGGMEGKIIVPEDFDEPIEDFIDYM